MTEDTGEASKFDQPKWILGTTGVLTLIAFAMLAGFRAQARPVFDFLLENLPLTLPILSVFLSIATRPHEFRSLQGVLNISNYFSLGLVTFAIWAYVAAQGVEEYVRVGDRTVMDKDYALLLLLGAFTWAGFCAVVTALADSSHGSSQRVWRWLQGTLAAISLPLLISPLFLFESKSEVEQRTGMSFDEGTYSVSVAFQDPGLNQHLGRSTDPLLQCQVYKGIRTLGAQAARDTALSQFMNSVLSDQFPVGGRRDESPKKVQIIESLVLVAEQDGVR